MLRVVEQYSGTDTGLQRRANEDSLLARAPLFVVADGMGGAQAGEVASQMAIEAFQSGLEHGSDPQSELRDAAQAANARIHELSQSNPEQAGMGTTLTALYVGEDQVTVAQVGDSRAYCLRDGELERLTDDHSLVDELIRQGKLTPEEAADHPQRSIITRALGPEAAVDVDTRSFRARGGDVFLLCSDGLTTMLAEDELQRMLLGREGRLREAGEALIAAANAAGGRDNITVILLRLGEVEPSSESQLAEEVTMTGMAPVIAPEASTSGAGALPAGAALAPAPVAQASSAADARAPTAPSLVAPLRPRSAGAHAARTRRRRLRLGPALVGLTILAVLGAGAYIANQSVYFIGTNEVGLVTVFNGLPYELPGGLKLYTKEFVSGVSASTLTPGRRHTLLNDSLRSQTDANELVRELELGRLSGQ